MEISQNIYNLFYEKIHAIAIIYMDIYNSINKYSGYNHINNISLHDNFFTFKLNCSTPGIGFNVKLQLEDVFSWKDFRGDIISKWTLDIKKQQQEKLAQTRRLQELECSPDVSEFQQLTHNIFKEWHHHGT